MSKNNHDDETNKIVEDSPQLRSMAIAPPSSDLMSVSSRYGSNAKPLFASPMLLQPAPSKQSPSIEAEETGWPNLTVLPLPAFYCLERTHVHINSGNHQRTSSPEQVAQRITECLQKDSIAVTFSGNEATANSSDSVNFSIRLWSQEESKQLTVEVQRLCGCGYSYQQLARRILSAAKGECCKESPQPRTFKLPTCVPQESQEEREQCIKQGLEIAECLLQQNKMDTQLMALESLIQISSACQAARLFAARSILSNEYTFLNTLTCLIETHRLDPAHGDSQATTELEEDHYAKLHRQALEVFANCLVTLADAGELDQVLGQTDSGLSSDAMLSALTRDVAQSETLPHDASQALRCLHSLCRCSKTVGCGCVQGFMLRNDVLATAQRYGLRRHAQLQEHATQLQLQMQRDH